MQAQDPSQRFGHWFLWLAWCGIIALGYWFFDGQLTEQHNPNQQPSSSTSRDGERRVELIANPAGHYVGTLYANGVATTFMLDTGATTIAVPAAVADKLGMKAGRSYQVDTANGTTTAYQSQIQHLQLGSIALHDLPATIVPAMQGNEILLGMSALKHLEFTQRDKTLTLIQQP